jgi:CheY-like chemotaxis protein
MSKIDANKFELASVEFDLAKMIDRVIVIINFRLEEKHQQFSLYVDQNIPRFIVGDDHRLAQIIMNLISNAVKFTPEKGKISLDVTLVSENNGVCELRFTVTDSGIGIPPEQQSKLFSMFVQAESGITRKYGGTGLGLAISKNIVELMDGAIWVESEIDKGAHFIFTIKARRGNTRDESCDKEAEARSPFKPSLTDNKFTGKKLLLVDDVEINREIAIALLENDTELIIDTAEDGQQALDMIAADLNKYDIVLMDMQMPIMNGLEATRRVRELPGRHGKRLPIIAMTANVFKSDIEECVAAGMDDHLGKPLDITKVLEKLHEYL